MLQNAWIECSYNYTNKKKFRVSLEKKYRKECNIPFYQKDQGDPRQQWLTTNWI